MKRKFKAVIVATATVIMVLNMLLMSGCGNAQATSLMDGVEARDVEVKEDLSSENEVVTDFAVRLFNESYEAGENVLVSPLSVLCALAMTANGAKEETLRQMEEVLGMSVDELNVYVHSYLDSLSESKACKLKLANSIWFTEHSRFTVNQDFLQLNQDYYGADIYKAPFDESTLKDINDWIKENTDEMIPKALDKIPEDAVMYLINALAFDAEWAEIYKESQVRDGVFTLEDKTTKTVEFMYSEEGNYIEDDNATGFIKYYKERKYAFVALLPNENVTVEEYVSTLTGKKISSLLANPKGYTVNAAIPKFETEYSVEMSEVLKNMGMVDAFDGNKADFSGLGTSDAGNLSISRVLHKTFIAVDEKGTKAGAATVVEVTDECAPIETEIKTVYLNRPFVYMLIDCENNIPFFIGTMMDVE